MSGAAALLIIERGPDQAKAWVVWLRMSSTVERASANRWMMSVAAALTLVRVRLFAAAQRGDVPAVTFPRLTARAGGAGKAHMVPA